MELIKNTWKKSDKVEFLNHLESFSKGKEKSEWEQRIVNTKLPCIAVPSDIIKDITRQIHKGNFIEFIKLDIWDNFSAVSVMGNLICKIKDFDTLTHYLDKYSAKVDNWAHCDLLKLNIRNREESFLKLSDKYLQSTLPFQRRIGLIILFKFANEKYIDRVLKVIDSLKFEEEYYVNMANAWLLCECFIKERERTLSYLHNHTLNKFTINKAISKIRDSFRVTKADKEMLLKYKIK